MATYQIHGLGTSGLLGSSDEIIKMKWLERQIKREAETTIVGLLKSFSQLLASSVPEDSSGWYSSEGTQGWFYIEASHRSIFPWDTWVQKLRAESPL